MEARRIQGSGCSVKNRSRGNTCTGWQLCKLEFSATYDNKGRRVSSVKD